MSMNRTNSQQKKHQPTGDYEIGYCKPPKHAQFPKGVSGNPSGRPKKPPSMAEVLQNGLNRPVTIVENGQRKTVTKMEAVVESLTDKSIVGDVTASRLLLGFARLLSDSPSVSGA